MKSLPELVRRAGNVLTVLLFAVVLALPLFSSWAGFAPLPSLQEKRNRAGAPEFRFDSPILAEFPEKYEAYFNDNFAFRDQLVLWHNFVKVRGLKASSSPKVVIGKKGWLYYQGGLIDHDHAVAPFTEEQLSEWLRVLEARQEWLAARGIRFVIVFAPDKHTVYPEYLPDWIKRVGPSRRLDQLLGYVRERSNLSVVDLRESLLQAKKQEQVYYKTDTHWNYRGGFVGDHSIAKALSRWYPRVQPLSRSEYAPVSERWPGDMTTMLGLPKFTSRPEPDVRLEPIMPTRMQLEYEPDPKEGKPDLLGEIPDADLPKAVVFHDSFGLALQPYLSQHFRRVAYNQAGREAFDTLLVEREKPDVVICEYVERRFSLDVMPNDPASVAESLKDKIVREQFDGTSNVLLNLVKPDTIRIDVAKEAEASSGPTGLEVQTKSKISLTLPCNECNYFCRQIARIEITSPDEASLEVDQTHSGPFYPGEKTAISHCLHKGRNIVYTEIPGPDFLMTPSSGQITERLQLEICGVSGQYILHGIEIRELPLKKTP